LAFANTKSRTKRTMVRIYNKTVVRWPWAWIAALSLCMQPKRCVPAFVFQKPPLLLDTAAVASE
jgi:hypothetical protein